MNFRVLAILFIIIYSGSCESPHEPMATGLSLSELTAVEHPEMFDHLPDSHMEELLPCDILVRPNLSFSRGLMNIPTGGPLGHAAIVIQGATDTSEAALLGKVIIFESQARDVNHEYQLRTTPAFSSGNDFSFANYNFSPDKLGKLYRLRLNLTESQKDSIIDWILDQDDDLSSYRALKRFGPDHDSLHLSAFNGGKQEYWYCSLLIWQAFYDVLGIDLDADRGLYVYPNDLIYSPYFDDKPGMPEKRVRF